MGTTVGETSDVFDVDTGKWIGVLNRQGKAQVVPTFNSDETALVGTDGAVLALATAGTPGTTLTATGTGYSGACEFWGLEVSAYNGGPQTIVVRNSVDASGPIVATFAVSGTGFFSYSGPGNAPGGGQNLSRAMSAGVHLTISGGTSRSVTPIISAV